jgi:hypothetical protein
LDQLFGITISWYLQAASTGRRLTSVLQITGCVSCFAVRDRSELEKSSSGHGIGSFVISGIFEFARLMIHLWTHSHSRRKGVGRFWHARTPKRQRQLPNLLFLALPRSKLDLAFRYCRTYRGPPLDVKSLISGGLLGPLYIWSPDPLISCFLDRFRRATDILLEKLENLDSLFLIIVQFFVDDSTSLLHLGAGQISATLFLRLGAHSRSATNWNKKWS